MNGDTRAIAEITGLAIEQAFEIQRYIDKEWLLDWSECTIRQFHQAVEQARQVLGL